MKRLFKIKYPKILALILVSVLSYIVFTNPSTITYIMHLDSLSYLGTLIGGFFFSFGFSTPFAIGYFLTENPQNILFASIIGGSGALIGDLAIFKFIKFSFMDEFNQLKKTRTIVKIHELMERNPIRKINNYLLFIFAGIVIASPLPDEIAVSMLAGMTKINSKILALVSFTMNTIGIYILLSL